MLTWYVECISDGPLLDNFPWLPDINDDHIITFDHHAEIIVLEIGPMIPGYAVLVIGWWVG